MSYVTASAETSLQLYRFLQGCNFAR